jgi:hypothetical protein
MEVIVGTMPSVKVTSPQADSGSSMKTTSVASSDAIIATTALTDV